MGLTSGTTGAIGELLVAADLLQKGYHVFRAQSPSCPCDLAILKDNRLLRVEVRTGHRSRATGKVYPPVKDNLSNGKYDLYVQVVHGPLEITYFPPLGTL